MKEITERLHKKVMDEFYPMAVELAEKGHDKNFIVAAFQSQLKIKTKQYYDKLHPGLESMRKIFADFTGLLEKQSADSKAEMIFYDMLVNSGVKFEFQYSIGPYKADYLFAGLLVVELDGPQHDKDHDLRRDAYMRKMGYKIIRVPIWVLVSCPEAVIDEIKQATGSRASP